MPYFRVTIEVREDYYKDVDAATSEEARTQVEAEDSWGSPDTGWKRGDNCHSDIMEWIEELPSA